MLSLYVHIPFCRRRCGYCDFNTYSGLEDLIAAYVDALEIEIREVGEGGGRPSLDTIFFGGGTPSILEAPHFDRLMHSIRAFFQVEPDAENSIEANPGGLSEAYLRQLAAAGFNRLSLGVQSVHSTELAVLDRHHGIADVTAAIDAARAAGFTNLNLDLIYGIPGQTRASWNETLVRVLDMTPEHLSLYALTLEHGTPLRRAVRAGKVDLPDDDLAAEMYEHAGLLLAEAGYRQYEISNWARCEEGAARGSRMCRHNLQYWHNLPYLGLGAGAHGYALSRRYSNVLAPAAYIRRLRSSPRPAYPFSRAVSRREVIPREEEMRQTMWLGLRLTEEGVQSDGFRERFGCTPEDAFGREIEELTDLRLLERAGIPARLRLTERGRLVANQVFLRFV